MRLFLAINLGPDQRRAIADAIGPLRAEAPRLNWAGDARLHLTLKFLGEQPPESATGIARAMDGVATRHRRFVMRLGGIGAFPNFRRPRVVWMGVTPDPRLELLHHDVEEACASLGFDVEGRAFRPHLTLARVRDRMDGDVLRRLSRAGKGVAYSDASVVESIDLMQSIVGVNARYERMHVAPLRDA